MTFGRRGVAEADERAGLPWQLEGPASEDWDWWVLVDNKGRHLADASVEGSSEEWRAIALALIEGTSLRFKRLAADREADAYYFSSPRNSMGQGARLEGRDRHIAFAKYILATLDPFKGPLT